MSRINTDKKESQPVFILTWSPGGKNSSGQNQLAALGAAHDLALKKPKGFVLVL